MNPTVLLFDVDGTLVLTGGAGRLALEHAFEVVCGRRDACDGIAFGGLTDRRILRLGLTALGRPVEPPVVDALLEAYLEALPELVARSTTYRVMPAVDEVLAEVTGREGVAVGLGTGNVERGARVKLARAGLDRHFAFGGFGCDDEDRATLLAAGARRGAERLGVSLERCRVVAIGDTPRDVAAARAIGAECLAVATGSYDEATLAESGATRVTPELTGAAEWLVG